MLRNGWKFGDDYEMTAVDVINGQKLGWALGCMLYEINTRKFRKNFLAVSLLYSIINIILYYSFSSLANGLVPWDFHPELLMRGPSWWLVTLYVIIGTLVGSAVGFTIAMRTSKKFNKAVRQSVFFKKAGIAGYMNNHPGIRKSLALPVSEFDEVDDVDETQLLVK